MKNIFNKMILAVLAAALIFAAFPMTSAFAQGENPPKGELTNAKLEQVWARQLKNYEKIGKGFENTDAFIAKIQLRPTCRLARQDGPEANAAPPGFPGTVAAARSRDGCSRCLPSAL